MSLGNVLRSRVRAAVLLAILSYLPILGLVVLSERLVSNVLGFRIASPDFLYDTYAHYIHVHAYYWLALAVTMLTGVIFMFTRELFLSIGFVVAFGGVFILHAVLTMEVAPGVIQFPFDPFGFSLWVYALAVIVTVFLGVLVEGGHAYQQKAPPLGQAVSADSASVSGNRAFSYRGYLRHLMARHSRRLLVGVLGVSLLLGVAYLLPCPKAVVDVDQDGDIRFEEVRFEGPPVAWVRPVPYPSEIWFTSGVPPAASITNLPATERAFTRMIYDVRLVSYDLNVAKDYGRFVEFIQALPRIHGVQVVEEHFTERHADYLRELTGRGIRLTIQARTVEEGAFQGWRGLEFARIRIGGPLSHADQAELEAACEELVIH